MRSFDDTASLLEALNSASCRYVVLRNYESLLSGTIMDERHPDIDILTDGSRALVDTLGARPAHSDDWYGDGVHYYIDLQGRKVSVDLRSVGDGYYCPKWEAEILDRRQPLGSGCLYTPDDTDSFYTLLYHAMFQKPRMSDDYRDRLCGMALRLGINATDFGQEQWIEVLEAYMRQYGYKYTYCTDYHVPLYRRWSDSTLTDLDMHLWYVHFRYDTKIKCIELAVKVKHALHL